MTWGKLPPHKLRETRQRDKKVAVSPSRPLICCVAASWLLNCPTTYFRTSTISFLVIVCCYTEILSIVAPKNK